MKLFKRTKDHQTYWKERKIDWKAHYQNWDHPHRFLISHILKTFGWYSLIEVGCAAGANLINIVKSIPSRQVGGVDISADAIAQATETFKGGVFKVGSGDNIMMSDKSTDVVLTDMTLIYVSKKDIGRYLKEIKRIARSHVVLCEFDSKSWWMRLKLKLSTGYNAHDYKKILGDLGFYDINKYKIPPEMWEGGEPQKTYGYIVVARVPKRG
jgi:ubiquinone/menaquinone biosynthesis C-methylase UbiE